MGRDLSVTHRAFAKASGRLRRVDRPVFSELFEHAQADQTAFVPLERLAEQGWGRLEYEQAKNNVHRSISEIRNELSHEVILTKNSAYRLDLEELDTWMLSEEFRKNQESSSPALAPPLFSERLSELVRRAGSDEAVLTKLIVWGSESLAILKSAGDDLNKALESSRCIQVFCDASAGRTAIDLIRQLIDGYFPDGLGAAYSAYSGSFQIIICNCPPGNGAAWIDQTRAKSLVETEGDAGKTLVLGSGEFAIAYASWFDERRKELQASVGARSPLILVDHLDRRLFGQAELLLRYYARKRISDPEHLVGPLGES